MMSSSSGGRVDDQPFEARGAQHLDVAGDVLHLDQARVHRLAAQNPPLGEVSLVAVEIEHGYALAFLRRAHGQREASVVFPLPPFGLAIAMTCMAALLASGFPVWIRKQLSRCSQKAAFRANQKAAF